MSTGGLDSKTKKELEKYVAKLDVEIRKHTNLWIKEIRDRELLGTSEDILKEESHILQSKMRNAISDGAKNLNGFRAAYKKLLIKAMIIQETKDLLNART